jgi:hypothetical protein
MRTLPCVASCLIGACSLLVGPLSCTVAQTVARPGSVGPLPAASKASLNDQGARAHVFADPNFFHWGGTPVRGEDGVYHLYYDRWRRDNPRLMRGWLYDSEIAHATATQPEGPYQFQDVALRGAGDVPAGRWDAFNAHNAYCAKFPDPDTGELRYYLYFVANRDNNTMFNDWYDRIVNQRIGVAVSDSPNGPWTRHSTPACSPSSPLLGYVVNPGVTRLPDGRYLMLLKGRQFNPTPGATNDTMGAYLQGWALSDRPTGPFVIQPTLLFPGSIPAEDPCVFVWNNRVYAAVKDWNGQLSGTAGISWIYGTLNANGSITWTIPSPRADALLSLRRLTWSDSTITSLHTLERPFVLQDETGRPTHLFGAASVQDPFLFASFAPMNPPPLLPGSNLPFNVCIPLLHGCGSADFDGDGDTGTDADIAAFFACLGGDCCGTCETADFNRDGDTGTDADIESFFRVLGGGAC